MPSGVSSAEFLWLTEHEKRMREAHKKKKVRVRVKKNGCGSKKYDEQMRARGWKKIGCGMWKKKVE